MIPWLEPFARFTLRDGLDILLVAAIAYQVLLLLKGTRVMNMLVGLGSLLVLYSAARLLTLRALNSLLGAVFFYLPLALLLLFQQDIRRILTSLVKNPFSRLMSAGPEEKIIQEIVLASAALSSRHTGALIVLERGDGLRQVAETGVAVGGEVSLELLETIFMPRTPLHDGAVIIQGDRIAAAGCFLPLTQNAALTKEFGTRHRAAIGITEETDAVAVVVSEETGMVSFAVDGHLQRFLDSKSLRELLFQYLVAKRQK
jgi:diadenylate cyclase